MLNKRGVFKRLSFSKSMLTKLPLPKLRKSGTLYQEWKVLVPKAISVVE